MAYYLDNFTDTNGTTLDLHTADSGETYSSDGNAIIHNNRAYTSATGATDYPEVVGLTTGAEDTHTYTLQFYKLPGAVGDIAFYFGGTTAGDAYLIDVRANDNLIKLSRWAGGGFDGWLNANIAISFPTDNRLYELELIHTNVGTDRITVKFDGSTVHTDTDTTYSANGKKIFHRYGLASAATTTTGLHLDSFLYGQAPDTEKPVITLNGPAVIDLMVGDTYTELGATWTDNVDGSGPAVVGGDVVDENTVGTYIVDYDYTDMAGNAADTVQRTVNVLPFTWTTVVFDGTIPDMVNTESFYEEAISDLGFTMEVGDILYYEPVAGLSVDAQMFPIVMPPATVSGQYKIWDDSAGVFTGTGVYQWVDTAVDIAIPTGSLSLTGFAPTVAIVANDVNIDVPAGAVTLTGQAPSVIATANVWIDIPAGVVSLTGFAPAVDVTADRNISVPAGAVTITGFAPTITGISVNIEIPAGAVTLTGFAPFVSAGVSDDVLTGVIGLINGDPVGVKGKIDSRYVTVSGKID